MTIDRALSGNPFGIDRFRCRDAAEVLRTFEAQHQVEAWSGLPQLSQFVFKTLFVSICHQFNWDFLQGALAGWLLPDPDKKLAEISAVRASTIERLLRGYPQQERVRADERARMLRLTASELLELVDEGKVQRLLAKPQLEGPSGYYQVMRSLSAFAEDELEKKSRVLAHELFREKIVAFADPANLRPAVEYHILRLYVRSGRVYPTHESVREQLLSRGIFSRPRLVKLLRTAVEEAMNLTAFYASLDVATLNYVEWQIGRAVCAPSTPRCTDISLAVLPEDVAALSSSQCPYAGFCRSHTDPQYGWYHEPHFQKAIY